MNLVTVGARLAKATGCWKYPQYDREKKGEKGKRGKGEKEICLPLPLSPFSLFPSFPVPLFPCSPVPLKDPYYTIEMRSVSSDHQDQKRRQ